MCCVLLHAGNWCSTTSGIFRTAMESFEFNIGMLTTIKSPEQLGIGQTAPDTDDEVATEHVASVAKKKKGQKKKGSKLKSS